jgi:hypothetical protein
MITGEQFKAARKLLSCGNPADLPQPDARR